MKSHKVALRKGHPALVKTMKLTTTELDNAKVKMLKGQIASHAKGIYGKGADTRRDLLGAPAVAWQKGPYKNQWKFMKPMKDGKPSARMKPP